MNKCLRYLNLIELDAKSLMERAIKQKEEYIEIFASRRTRDHFDKVFYHRFFQLNYQELSYLEEETAIALFDFYNQVNRISWYLLSTQDMPATLEEKLHYKLGVLQELFEKLELFLGAQIAVERNKSD